MLATHRRGGSGRALTTWAIGLAALAACSRTPHVEYATPPSGSTVDVETPAGTLRGIESEGLRYFLGVPYAAPPLGSLRFAPPQRLPRAATPIDATRYGSACLQIPGHQPGDPLTDETVVEGSEDCLTLNVIAHADGAPRAVMVFVHGGAYQQGNGSKPDYEGTILAREGDVVVVTLNYRLGALGFFASEELVGESLDGSAGNQGIRDQIAALEWVHDNIAALGGDPDRVLVFGESAGAGSVCVLASSPLAEGLFHAALLQSTGGCVDVVPLRTDAAAPSAVGRGEAVAAQAGCTGEGALACLRGLDGAALVRSGTRVADAQSGFGLFHAPCIDGAVLPGAPLSQLARASGDVPLVVGSNADESSAFLLQTEVADEAEYRTWLERLFGDDAEAVAAVYPPASLGSHTATLRRAMTEVRFTCPGYEIARAAGSAGAPSYAYYFTFHRDGRLAEALGAFHSLELGYVFGRYSDELHADDTDRAVGRAMRGIWSSFARDAVPTSTPAWPEYAVGEATILEIDATTSLIGDPTGGRCAMLIAAGVVQGAR